MEALINWVHDAPWWQAVAVLLAENLFVLFFALALGRVLIRCFEAHRVAPPAPPLERQEVLVTCSTVLLNTVVTLAGWFLWRAGIIRYRTDVGVWAWLDIPILLLVMDLAMYVLHRLAH